MRDDTFFSCMALSNSVVTAARQYSIHHGLYLDLKDGLVKQQHEVSDDPQHLSRVCCVISLAKVLCHFLHLTIHLCLKLLQAFRLSSL